MTDLSTFRDTVVAGLKSQIDRVAIEKHGGTFDLAELKRIALNAPAIRVSIIGVGRHELYNDGRWKLPVNFAAVVITRDTAEGGEKINRDTAALLLSTAVELAIAGNRFGIEGVFRPENLEARSEYSGQVDQMGIALWQVTWTSTILLGETGEQSPAHAAQAISALIKALVNEVTTFENGALTLADPLQGGGA